MKYRNFNPPFFTLNEKLTRSAHTVSSGDVEFSGSFDGPQISGNYTSVFMRFPVVLFALLFLTCRASSAIAAPGEFDRSFGQNGIANLPTDVRSYASHVTTDSSGRVLATGTDRDAEFLARLLPNGGADTSFSGTGYIRGVARIPDANGFPMVLDNSGQYIASLADGQVLAVRVETTLCVGGPICRFNGPTVRARRFNSDGSMSSANNADVVVGPGSPSRLVKVVNQQAGGLLFVSRSIGVIETRTVLHRLGENGLVDASFAANTTAAESCRVASTFWNEGGAVALPLPDGKTVLAQSVGLLTTGIVNTCLSRLNADGTRDQAYLAGGSPIPVWPSGSVSHQPVALFSTSNGGAALLLQKSVLQSVGRRYEYLLVWLTAQGMIDTTRPDQGMTVARDTPVALITAAAMQADGKIILAGYPTVSLGNANGDQSIDYSQPRVVRLNLQGGTDTTYGPGGEGYTPLISFGKRLIPNQLHVAADGSVFIAGQSTDAGQVMDNEPRQFAIAKLLADPPPVQPASQNSGGGGGGGCGITRDPPRVDPMLPGLAILALLALASRRKRHERTP